MHAAFARFGPPPLDSSEERSPAMHVLLAFFGFPGLPEMLIVGMIMLLLFGNRLHALMRSLGQGIVEFKEGVKGIEDNSDRPGASENK